MIARRASSLIALFFTLSLFGIETASADGGRLQFREPCGPFIVSLFAQPDNLLLGPADLSVLVQNSDDHNGSGQIAFDSRVVLVLTPPAPSPQHPMTVTLSHQTATNHLLQAAQVQFTQSGPWKVTVRVTEGASQGQCSTTLLVGHRKTDPVTTWLFLAIPALLVLVYAIAQTNRPIRPPPDMVNPSLIDDLGATSRVM